MYVYVYRCLSKSGKIIKTLNILVFFNICSHEHNINRTYEESRVMVQLNVISIISEHLLLSRVASPVFLQCSNVTFIVAVTYFRTVDYILLEYNLFGRIGCQGNSSCLQAKMGDKKLNSPSHFITAPSSTGGN